MGVCSTNSLGLLRPVLHLTDTSQAALCRAGSIKEVPKKENSFSEGNHRKYCMGRIGTDTEVPFPGI